MHQNQQFDPTAIVNQIHSQISSKLSVYEQIVQKNFSVDKDQAHNIVSAELANYTSRLKMYISDPAHLKNGGQPPQISLESGTNIFLEVMQSGLSFSVIANHVYLSRMKGTGINIGYKVTADGDVYRAQRAGSIDHCSEVVLVTAGEPFSIVNTPEGRQVAVHTIFFDGRPKFSFNNFLAGYVYIVYPNGDRELSWISKERIGELKAKSQNQGMYDDETFIQTKVLKHAMKKVRKTPIIVSEVHEDDEPSESTVQQQAKEQQSFQPPSLPAATTQQTHVVPQMQYPQPQYEMIPAQTPQYQQPAPAAPQYQPQYQQPQYQQTQQFNQPTFQEPF